MSRLPDTFETPGFVDLHIHAREPGTNPAETIVSASRAAMHGGYAMTVDMPNNPGRPTWDIERLEEKAAIINATSYTAMGVNTGSQPESDNIGQLEAMSRRSIMYKIYATATTGNHVEYEAKDFRPNVAEWHRVAPDKPIGVHAGKHNLMDFIGMVAGDFAHPLHVHHITNPQDVALVLAAKGSGMEVTSGVCPHHLLKTSHDVSTEGWWARMQPPLAHQDDAEELLSMLALGAIDVIETDHAPHLPQQKIKAEAENPDGIVSPEHTSCFGVPGIEFAFPLLAYQIARGTISMERVIDAMSTQPARIIGVTIAPEPKAVWHRETWRIDDEHKYVQSGAAWTPYLGMLAGAKLFQSNQAVRLMRDNTMQPRFVADRGTVI